MARIITYLVAVVLIVIATITFLSISRNSVLKKVNQDNTIENRKKLETEAQSLDTAIKTRIELNSKYGVLTKEKSATISALQAKKETIVVELAVKEQANKLSSEDLVKLKQVIEELRSAVADIYIQRVDLEKNNRHSTDIDKLQQLLASKEKMIESEKGKIKKFRDAPFQIDIAHFYTLDRKSKEWYTQKDVKYIKFDLSISGCIPREKGFVSFMIKDPNEEIIRVDDGHQFKIEKFDETGLYPKKYPVNFSQHPPGRYFLIIKNQNDVTLATAFVDLL